MKITFFFFFATSVWWRMMAHTVILALQYGWTCLIRGFIGVGSGSGWRAWWDVMVRLSEVPLFHYRARTSDLSAHWNSIFPSPSFSWIEIRDELWVLFLQLLSPTPTNLFLTWRQTTAPAWEKNRSCTREGECPSLGVGQRKESLGGSKFRENHPKMSHLLYTMPCPC